MAWVSFDQIKKTVSLEMVLNHYRLDLRRVGAGALRGACPLPTHGAEHKNRASFTATLTKGTGGVWACQSTLCVAARDGKKGGNALDFVAAMESCSIRDAAVKLAEWFNVPATAPNGAEPHTDPQPEKPAQLVSKESSDGAGESGEVNKPLTFTLQGVDAAHPYVKSRAISEETARTFGVGFFPGRGSMSGRVVVPIHNELGELVAYAGRAIDGSEPKYKFPAGFHKSLELYNLHRAMDLDRIGGRGVVVVVEGFFDCLVVHQADYPCVALMGSSLSERQADSLARYFTGVVLILDGDDAGRQATDECLVKVGRRGLWVKAVVLEEGKQPDMLSGDEIDALVKE